MNSRITLTALALVMATGAQNHCLAQRNDSTRQRDIVVGSARAHSSQLSADVPSIANNRAAVFIENRGQGGSSVRFPSA